MKLASVMSNLDSSTRLLFYLRLAHGIKRSSPAPEELDQTRATPFCSAFTAFSKKDIASPIA
jgi:hypothetical protein